MISTLHTRAPTPGMVALMYDEHMNGPDVLLG